MEMNTRLQVEHPVTEMVTGIDLVEWQLRVAAGERCPLPQRACGSRATPSKRACAPRTVADFLPQAGRIALWHSGREACAPTTRSTSGVDISPFYDSMIAKVIAHGPTRDEARAQLARALDDTVALGVPTNKAFLAAVLRDAEFARGRDHRVPRQRFAVEPRAPDAATLRDAATLLAATRVRRMDFAGATIRRARCRRNSTGATSPCTVRLTRIVPKSTRLRSCYAPLDRPAARPRRHRRREETVAFLSRATRSISRAAARATASRTSSMPAHRAAAAAKAGCSRR